MTDVFISYGHEDRAIARRFADSLHAEGLAVWWDEALRSGEAFDERIEQALRTAKAVIVLWSEHSATSRWVRAEATLADRKGTLVPVMIGPCERPIMFLLTHTLDLSHWAGDAQDSAWQDLLKEIRRFVGREPGSARAAVGSAPVPREAGASPVAKPGEAGEAPSLAVLPFNNRSNLPDDDVFAEGMVEDLISALAQGANLRVLGSASTSSLRKGSFSDLAAVGRRLGVRFLLEGNVRRVGTDLRVTTQLLDAATGAVEWTGKFDRPLAELAELQEDLVLEVAASLDARVAALEMSRALRKPRDLTAWEAVMRSIAAYRGGASQPRALEEAKHAVAIAPDYALAQAQLAFTRAMLYFTGSPDDDAEVQAIRTIASRAVALSPDDGFVLSSAGGALAYIGFPHDARAHLERSIKRMPGNGLAHMNLALALCLLSRPDEALAHLDTAARLMPDSPWQYALHLQRSNALLLAERWADAETEIDVAITLNPQHNRATKAFLCRRAGRSEEARHQFEHFRRSGASLQQLEIQGRRFFASGPVLDELRLQLRALWAETEPSVP